MQHEDKKMKTKNVTLEQLAFRFEKSVWIKGDLKRIYVDAGYNTKKMSTQAYVFETGGEFIVFCRVECPTQAIQWIKSQEEEIKESIYSKISDFIERILDPSIDEKEDAIYLKASGSVESVMSGLKVSEKKEVKDDSEFKVGETLNHSKWGNVTVISIDEKIIIVDWNGTQKKLVKALAPLSR